MREISPEEEAFILEALENRESYSTSASASKITPKRKRHKKRRFYQKVSTWAALIMLIPAILSTLFILNMMRIESIIGNDAIKVLTSDQLPEDFKEQAAAGGMEWIPQYVELYKNKELIVGGMFTVAILIVMIMFFIEAVVRYYRIRKENAEAILSEEA